MGRIISKEECIERFNKLDDSKEYNLDEDSIKGSTKKVTLTHHCGYKFEMVLKDFLRGARCPKCANEKRKNSNRKINKNIIISNKTYSPLKDERQKEILTILNENYPTLENFIIHDDTSKPVRLRKVSFYCKECKKTLSKNLSEILYNKQGCPECSKKRRRNLNIDIVKERFNERGFDLIGNFITTHKPVLLQCQKCGEYQERSYNTIINLKGRCSCDKRKASAGEQFILDFLKSNNIMCFRNKTFSGLTLEASLKFDFFIPDINTIIEYDGEQHFIPVDFFSRDGLELIQKRDRLKDEFCNNNNINIIRISYKCKLDDNLKNFLRNLIDGKPYDGKLSRTVWFGGKSDIKEYLEFNS